MAEKLLKAHSLYMRNAEIIERKKSGFNRYLGINAPVSMAVGKSAQLAYDMQSVRNFFLETESWNLRHFLRACDAKTDGDYNDSVGRLRLFGEKIAGQTRESMLTYHVADGFLTSFLLNHIPSYSTALQVGLAHAAACRSGDILTFCVESSDKSNPGLEIRNYSIMLGGAEVGGFNISYSRANDGGPLLQIMNPNQAIVYLKYGEKSSEMKSMGLVLAVDGSHSREVGGGKGGLLDFVESTCRNLLAIDFDAFAEELFAGIVLPSRRRDVVVKADLDSLLPSDFEIEIFSYPSQRDGGLQFSGIIAANLGEEGHILKIVLPKFSVFRQAEPDEPDTFSGAGAIMDARGNFLANLQMRYPLEHPLYPGLKN